MTNIAIEYGPVESSLIYPAIKWIDFPSFCVNVYQRVDPDVPSENDNRGLGLAPVWLDFMWMRLKKCCNLSALQHSNAFQALQVDRPQRKPENSPGSMGIFSKIKVARSMFIGMRCENSP